MAVIQAPQSGGGWNPLGILSTALSFFPGMQPFGAALGAANAIAKGNPIGAITSIAGLAAPKAPTTEFNFGATDYGQMARQGLSDLNAQSQAPAPDITPNLDTDFSAKGIVGNMPSNQKAMYGLKDQEYYDNKWNSLTDMYGVKGNTGFNPEAGKKHYRDFGAGGMFDNDNNSGIFDALMRLYNRG